MSRKLFALYIAALFIQGLFAHSTVHAGSNDLPVSQVPAELLTDADAVVREHSMRFVYEQPGRGELHVRRVITVLNREARTHGEVSLRYDSFTSVHNISAALYDSDGNRIRRIRNRDIDDRPAFSNINFVDDARLKSFELFHNQYPYNIELEYTIRFRGFINLPGFVPQANERLSVQNARFEVTLPVLQPVEFRTFNIENAEPAEELRGGNRKLSWELNNLPVIRREAYGPRVRDLIPLILIKSDEFSMNGENGSLQSWNDFGAWVNGLWSGRQGLTPETISRIEQIAASHQSQEEIIMALYSYLQRNSRYVSIQLGIGGWQTETALFTDQNRYGDCKALTNMLKAMLDVAGIPSYPALIASGDAHREIDPAFPFNSFNHAILMVPLESDTLWIESTSNIFPPGYIGRANHDRYTLVFNDNGGTLVRTPFLGPEQNFQQRKADISILPNGTASARINTRYGGHQHESIRYMAGLQRGAQATRVERLLALNRAEIREFQVEADPLAAFAGVFAELEVPSFGRRMGNRIFIVPNMFENHMRVAPAVQNRQQAVHLNMNYSDRDELVYKLPDNFVIEALPASVSHETSFGRYEVTYRYDDETHSLIYTRELRFEPAVLPAEKYELFLDFTAVVARNDQAQLVLVQAD
ncbi:MAG: DUF3857 domain-containing transglutaminase family protein [Candidatus Cyclonatronum sp.]|uniref:DUF3857 domain-containing transglutaminase family protein n=1 Tax=Cyclonatronum sp. TaxID=3024185 RepID=UPI0025B95D95|nr:DUF3857 domain-containing transglutaminase family protein [Cyclonatronum sp.]MCH8486341.1 DUF3857 domain-containing transglutaminase family protein [Cyclonatronum sp.]